MPVFSYVLQKVSRWELPSFHLPRREFSSPLFGGHLSASHSRMTCEHLSASHSRMAATRCHCESCDTLGVPLSGSPASPTGAAPSGSSASGSSASPSGAGVVLSGSSASHSRMAATAPGVTVKAVIPWGFP